MKLLSALFLLALCAIVGFVGALKFSALLDVMERESRLIPPDPPRSAP